MNASRQGLTSFSGLLGYIREQYKDRAAFLFARDGKQQQVTYGDFCDDVLAMSRRFTRKGLPVGLLGENSYEWIVAYFAIVLSGNIAVPLDNTANLKTLITEMDKACCSNLFYSGRYGSIVRDLRKSYPRFMASFPMDCAVEGSAEPFDLYQDPEEAAGFDDLFKGASVVIYTSGTTSGAKGVLLGQRSIVRNTVCTADYLECRPRVLVLLPLFHAYGLTCGVLIPLVEGCTTVLADEGLSMIQNLSASGAGTMLAVPAMLRMMMDCVIDAGGDLSLLGNVRQVVCGTAVLAPEILAFFEDRGIAIQLGYGMTECTCAVSINRLPDRRRDTVGPLVACNTVRISEPDQDGRGEILVTGENLMLGYLNEPELTRKAFVDGYLRTGDIGYLDGDGHLHITGRCKNLLVMSNGKKVAPEELENSISMLPWVSEALVFLAGGDTGRETIAAEVYIDPRDDSDRARQSVLESIGEMNRNLPIYKRIQQVFFRDSEFEKTSTRKIVRKPVTAGRPEAPREPDEAQQAITRRIADMISGMTDLSPEQVRPDSELFSDLGLDSLYFASLLSEICTQWDITISEENFRAIRTVNDITSIIRKEKATA